ncbi:unnamed protein product [Sphenostylis stenocarpa]|uniref:Uncharacterized protein n=1 Tax=Sphenostylis stenocarpa TaxID=92480 RepID=A0AA86RW31_9FABA|nr:unnamed protein product [Sphenostylis stenocarpa]
MFVKEEGHKDLARAWMDRVVDGLQRCQPSHSGSATTSDITAGGGFTGDVSSTYIIWGALARVGTYQVLLSDYGYFLGSRKVVGGLSSVYYVFAHRQPISGDGRWARRVDESGRICSTTIGSLSWVAASQALSIANHRNKQGGMCGNARKTQSPRPLPTVLQVKEPMRMIGSMDSKAQARKMEWTQEMAVAGLDEKRYALGKCDVKRFHQLVMSATSAVVGVGIQACVGASGRRDTRSEVQGTHGRRGGRE